MRKLEALNKLFTLFFGCTLAIGDQIFEFVGKRAANMSDPIFSHHLIHGTACKGHGMV